MPKCTMQTLDYIHNADTGIYHLHTLDLALVLLVYKLRPLLTAVTLTIMTLMLKADAKVFADLTC